MFFWLVKTSKGKYITRLEGSCSEDAANAYAVYAGGYDDGNKFRVVTPEGGYVVVKAGKGEMTYAKTKGNSKILVDEATGGVTVMTGLKKGTYKVKIKVTAAGNATYLAKSRTVTATVIVK